jgi:GT2 family glycosyltransferase
MQPGSRAADPRVAVVIPTTGRPEYLAVALDSILPQARAGRAEVVVVDDGHDPRTRHLARGRAVAYLAAPSPGGLNAARNAGVRATSAPLVVFVDDDVEVVPGWLEGFVVAAARLPGYEVFGGPIHPRLESTRLRPCPGDKAPITALELGSRDRDVELVWGANMAVRRGAFGRIGEFDVTIAGCGDEEDWERRLVAEGGRVRYVAAAGLYHRRTRADARVRPLMRAAHAKGRAARRYDARRGADPPLRREVRVLAGCLWHTLRQRCRNGLVMAAHSAGRLRQGLASNRPRRS